MVSHYFGDGYIQPGSPNTPTTTDDFDRYHRIGGVGEQYCLGAVFNVWESGHSLGIGLGSFYRVFGYKIDPDTLAFYGNNGQIRPVEKYTIADRNFELQLKYTYTYKNWIFGLGLKSTPGDRETYRTYYVDGGQNKFKRSRYNFGDIQHNPYIEVERKLPFANKHEVRIGLNVERRRAFSGNSNYWDIGLVVRYFMPIPRKNNRAD